jgi:hypothetical protein
MQQADGYECSEKGDKRCRSTGGTPCSLANNN